MDNLDICVMRISNVHDTTCTPRFNNIKPWNHCVWSDVVFICYVQICLTYFSSYTGTIAHFTVHRIECLMHNTIYWAYKANPPEALCMANKVCTLIKKNALEKENLERIGCKVTYYKRFPTIWGNAPMFFHKNESRPASTLWLYVSLGFCCIVSSSNN